MAELTEFRRLLRQCFADSQFFWDLAPANTPFAWYGDVADIPTGWRVLEDADGRYIIGSIDTAGTLGGSSANLTHAGAAVSAHANGAVADHTVTQPSQHAAGTTGSNGATTSVNEGAGTPVAINTTTHTHSTPALTHTGTAVSAHVVTQPDAHTVTQPNDHTRAEIDPLSLSFIWIVKDV